MVIYMIKKYEIIDGNIIVLYLDRNVSESDIEEVINAYFHERQTLIAENTLRKMNDPSTQNILTSKLMTPIIL